MSSPEPAYRRHIGAKLAVQPAGFGAAANLTPSAVLVPIVARAEPTMLFTRRTDHLPSHAGQICFPGGRMQADDETPITTALRETEEETGISRAFVQVAGFLDLYTTGTGFAIQPVVGFVRPEFSLLLNMEEVAEVFEAPLEWILDRSNYRHLVREWQGSPRPYYELFYGSHRIWGATAAMLVNLCEKLQER